eukprot:768564-Hanusia_phi.AAC.11
MTSVISSEFTTWLRQTYFRVQDTGPGPAAQHTQCARPGPGPGRAEVCRAGLGPACLRVPQCHDRRRTAGQNLKS